MTDVCALAVRESLLYGNVSNGTNSSSFSANTTYNLADTARLAAGCASFLLVLPFVLFQFPKYPIGSAAACLIGAFLMVCSGVVSQHDAYVILGSPESLRTIFLLLGMMLFSQYFEREHLIDILLSRVLKPGLSFGSCLWRLCLVSALLSALFTNDACCVVLTPLALKWWRTQNAEQREYDVEILLLGIATSSNIGSSATVFGNPQNALLAARTDKPEFVLSRFDLRRSLIYIGPAAAVGYLLNLGMLVFARWLLSRGRRWTTEPRPDCKVPEGPGMRQSGQNTSAALPLLNSAIQMDDLTSQQRRERSRNDFVDHVAGGDTGEHRVVFHAADELQAADSGTPPPEDNAATVTVEKAVAGISRKRIAFRVLLGLLMLVVVALFFASTEAVNFDMGLVPMGGAIVLMALDAGINRISPSEIVRTVDWTVLLMFLGIFVWLGGLNATHIPRYIWGHIGFMSAGFKSAREVAALCAFVTIGSNIFSNVPLTVVLMEQLIPCQDQLPMLLYISWTATIAGNLTLFGSVANLIVAGKALETTGFRLTFWRYLRFGFPSTLIIGTIGVLLINALLRLY